MSDHFTSLEKSAGSHLLGRVFIAMQNVRDNSWSRRSSPPVIVLGLLYLGQSGGSGTLILAVTCCYIYLLRLAMRAVKGVPRSANVTWQNNPFDPRQEGSHNGDFVMSSAPMSSGARMKYAIVGWAAGMMLHVYIALWIGNSTTEAWINTSLWYEIATYIIPLSTALLFAATAHANPLRWLEHPLAVTFSFLLVIITGFTSFCILVDTAGLGIDWPC